MYILLELDYAKFDISNLFSSKVIEEKPLGGRLLVKGGLISVTEALIVGLLPGVGKPQGALH